MGLAEIAGHLADVQVPDLHGPAREHEDIGALEIAVHDLEIVQGLESACELDEYAPYLLLGELGPVAGVLRNCLKEISLVGKLHNDAACRVRY